MAQTTLYSEGFESDGEATRYTTNTYYEASPNCNFFARSTASPLDVCFQNNFFSNFQGSFFWGSEDIMRTGTPLPAGQITSSLINITSYGSLQVSLFLATANNVTPTNSRWETADSINVQASINGGTFRTVGRFMGNNAFGGDLVNDVNLNGAVDVGEPIVSLNAFTQYTFSIPGTGSNLRIRLDFDQIGGSEELGIDAITVRGTVIVPVKWSHFEAKQVGDEVLLDWGTTEEVNAKEYVVERLVGDGSYLPIGSVQAAGAAQDYRFADDHPLAGQAFYRIRQVDLDNATSYTEAVAVHVQAPLQPRMFPNPTSSDVAIDFSGAQAEGHVQLFDAMGKLVISKAFGLSTSLELHTQDLPAGLYYVHIAPVGHKATVQKLVVRH